VLTYFDYFKFPLTIEEIQKFIEVRIGQDQLKLEIEQLVQSGDVFFNQQCYLLQDDNERVGRKIAGRKKAEKRMKRANLIASFIMLFPFVRMVAISGSLSKGYADKTTDIDFFIVTTENQLWTSRSLLHLLKKLTFLVRLQHSFCMNYFISEKHLKIEEQNYFTAVELVTLIPKKGVNYYNDLMSENIWVSNYLPNFNAKKIPTSSYKPRYFKWVLEKLLVSRKINESLMSYTDKRWRKKWTQKGYKLTEYDLAFKTQKTVSKNHPGNYQKKILEHIENNKIES
jgi:predicted nucleotidyltransferase